MTDQQNDVDLNLRTREVLPVAVFTFVYLSWGMFIATSKANWEFVFYIPVVVVLGATTLAIRERTNYL